MRTMSRVAAAIALAAGALVGASGAGAATALSPEMVVRAGESPVLYVVGSSCARATCLHLLRSTDAGVTYQAVAMPPTTTVADSSTGSLDWLVFATPTNGYALEGAATSTTLYVTRDGARTWRRATLPSGVDITALAATTSAVYVVTRHCATQSDGNEGCVDYQLAHSGPDATTWSSTAIPNGRNYPYGFLGGLTAFGRDVWLSEGAKWSLVVVSRDDGVTLATVNAPHLLSVAGCELTALSTLDLWAQCPTGMQDSFATSDDGGTTWTALSTRPFFGTGGGAFDPVAAHLAYLDYGSVTGTRNLYRVQSGTETAVGRLGCVQTLALVFTTPRRGVALCSNYSSTSLVRTTNGGANWTTAIVHAG